MYKRRLLSSSSTAYFQFCWFNFPNLNWKSWKSLSLFIFRALRIISLPWWRAEEGERWRPTLAVENTEFSITLNYVHDCHKFSIRQVFFLLFIFKFFSLFCAFFNFVSTQTMGKMIIIINNWMETKNIHINNNNNNEV